MDMISSHHKSHDTLGDIRRRPGTSRGMMSQGFRGSMNNSQDEDPMYDIEAAARNASTDVSEKKRTSGERTNKRYSSSRRSKVKEDFKILRSRREETTEKDVVRSQKQATNDDARPNSPSNYPGRGPGHGDCQNKATTKPKPSNDPKRKQHCAISRLFAQSISGIRANTKNRHGTFRKTPPKEVVQIGAGEQGDCHRAQILKTDELADKICADDIHENIMSKLADSATKPSSCVNEHIHGASVDPKANVEEKQKRNIRNETNDGAVSGRHKGGRRRGKETCANECAKIKEDEVKLSDDLFNMRIVEGKNTSCETPPCQAGRGESVPSEVIKTAPSRNGRVSTNTCYGGTRDGSSVAYSNTNQNQKHTPDRRSPENFSNAKSKGRWNKRKSEDKLKSRNGIVTSRQTEYVVDCLPRETDLTIGRKVNPFTNTVREGDSPISSPAKLKVTNTLEVAVDRKQQSKKKKLRTRRQRDEWHEKASFAAKSPPREVSTATDNERDGDPSLKVTSSVGKNTDEQYESHAVDIHVASAARVGHNSNVQLAASQMKLEYYIVENSSVCDYAKNSWSHYAPKASALAQDRVFFQETPALEEYDVLGDVFSDEEISTCVNLSQENDVLALKFDFNHNDESTDVQGFRGGGYPARSTVPAWHDCDRAGIPQMARMQPPAIREGRMGRGVLSRTKTSVGKMKNPHLSDEYSGDDSNTCMWRNQNLTGDHHDFPLNCGLRSQRDAEVTEQLIDLTDDSETGQFVDLTVDNKEGRAQAGQRNDTKTCNQYLDVDIHTGTGSPGNPHKTDLYRDVLCGYSDSDGAPDEYSSKDRIWENSSGPLYGPANEVNSGVTTHSGGAVTPAEIMQRARNLRDKQFEKFRKPDFQGSTDSHSSSRGNVWYGRGGCQEPARNGAGRGPPSPSARQYSDGSDLCREFSPGAHVNKYGRCDSGDNSAPLRYSASAESTPNGSPRRRATVPAPSVPAPTTERKYYETSSDGEQEAERLMNTRPRTRIDLPSTRGSGRGFPRGVSGTWSRGNNSHVSSSQNGNNSPARNSILTNRGTNGKQQGDVDWFDLEAKDENHNTKEVQSNLSTIQKYGLPGPSDYGGSYSQPLTAAAKEANKQGIRSGGFGPPPKKDPLACVEWQSWESKFLDRYKGLTVPFIDTHCHIDFIYDKIKFKGTYAKFKSLNEKTFPENYYGCVANFCNPRTFNPNGGLWKDLLLESDVWGAVGCHPKSATEYNTSIEEKMRIMCQHKKVVAVGEIGLDYSGTFSQHKEVQRQALIRQLRIAQELDKPIVIHCRDAEQDCINVLDEVINKNHAIHRHCFTGTWYEAETWLAKFPNSCIGLTPLLTHVNSYRSIGPREVAAHIPLERLILETDAPYFIPRQIPRDNMEQSHPGMAITVAEEVANIRNIPMDLVLKHCWANAKRLYRLNIDY